MTPMIYILLVAVLGISFIKAASGSLAGIEEAESATRAAMASRDDFMSDLVARLNNIRVRPEGTPTNEGVIAPPTSPRRPAVNVPLERKRTRDSEAAGGSTFLSHARGSGSNSRRRN